MDGFIDLHCHILPGVDDGAENMEMTIKMIHMARAEGIGTMIATPHYREGYVETSPVQLHTVYRQVLLEAQRIDPDFRIFLGNELYNCYHLDEYLEKGSVMTLAGSAYVLTEFSPSKSYSEMRSAFRKLQMAGYRPILAHTERYSCLRQDDSRVEELVGSGIYIQVNTSSVTGKNGYGARSFSRNLLKHGLVHFLATDAHNLKERGPEMKKCMEFVEKKYGSRYADRLGRKNAEYVLRNYSI